MPKTAALRAAVFLLFAKNLRGASKRPPPAMRGLTFCMLYWKPISLAIRPCLKTFTYLLPNYPSYEQKCLTYRHYPALPYAGRSSIGSGGPSTYICTDYQPVDRNSVFNLMLLHMNSDFGPLVQIGERTKSKLDQFGLFIKPQDGWSARNALLTPESSTKGPRRKLRTTH